MKKSSINKLFSTCFAALLICICKSSTVLAAPATYTVVSGDSMWKIAVRYQIGLSELAKANPQIKNPALIYPGQKITIPNIDDIKAIENEVIRLVNVERSKAGVPPLTTNWELSRVARYKSQDMINKGYFSHQSPTYGSPFDMMQNFGLRFSSAGENIAYGQRTPAEVMNSWMNSPGHRGNILSPSFTQIGVGVAKTSSGVYYWTQMFIKPGR
ncbi:SafA/ExsA family spore coat assembly protein [Haloimpatiens lingqiaonensis]|uniref:SafA/ExsA family spore coat assembly protein n=1 Tax=Haloimpatiens lingqiaonensis TaxID=1380675 RepID=UPI0037C11E7E